MILGYHPNLMPPEPVDYSFVEVTGFVSQRENYLKHERLYLSKGI